MVALFVIAHFLDRLPYHILRQKAVIDVITSRDCDQDFFATTII